MDRGQRAKQAGLRPMCVSKIETPEDAWRDVRGEWKNTRIACWGLAGNSCAILRIKIQSVWAKNRNPKVAWGKKEIILSPPPWNLLSLPKTLLEPSKTLLEPPSPSLLAPRTYSLILLTQIWNSCEYQFNVKIWKLWKLEKIKIIT